jgi:transposase InsO family protein
MLVSHGLSERRSIRHMKFVRSTIRYEAEPESELNRRLRKRLRALAHRWRRLGTPMMTELVRRQGLVVNHKRVERLWGEEKLTLPRRKPRRRRKGTPPEQRFKAPTAPNQVWAYDFVHDRTEYGHKVRILTITDEFTHESLELRAGWRMNGRSVMEALDQLFNERGRPRYVRSDNGAEFRNVELTDWLSTMGVTPIYIDPGCPWQNGVAESFHSRLREEWLNQELFYSRAECQVLLDWYREEYNRNRPHSSLGYATPQEFANMYSASRQN